MWVFLFQYLPLILFLLLMVGVALLFQGIRRGSRPLRWSGMGVVAVVSIAFCWVLFLMFARI